MSAPANLEREGGRIGQQLSLLPEAPFSPRMPPPASVAARALQHLLRGESLTHTGFLAHSGSWRLAAHVRVLREHGWPVETADIAAPSASCPTRHIARYELPQWVLQVMGGQHGN